MARAKLMVCVFDCGNWWPQPSSVRLGPLAVKIQLPLLKTAETLYVAVAQFATSVTYADPVQLLPEACKSHSLCRVPSSGVAIQLPVKSLHEISGGAAVKELGSVGGPNDNRFAKEGNTPKSSEPFAGVPATYHVSAKLPVDCQVPLIDQKLEVMTAG